MPVLLHTPAALPPAETYDNWAVIGMPCESLDTGARLPGLDEGLEDAFRAIAPDWWRIGRELSAEETADVGYTPACASNLSDFGLMLAWSRLVEEWAGGLNTVLVVCDDPWLFRHLAVLTGVTAGSPPALRSAEARLFVRGYASRFRTALRLAAAGWRMRGFRRGAKAGNATILVYGHPTSTPDSHDGYFGGLMKSLPTIDRVLHADCPPDRARELMADGRTKCLHSWGNPLAALGLIFTRWRPSAAWKKSSLAWLVRRAARREAGTAGAAAIRWQQHCQANWLRTVRPSIVTWPWENHSWERVFVRQCRTMGVKTVGYQHSVIGPMMLNYAPASVRDGPNALPDTILTAGEMPARQLRAWEIPDERINVGGAWRIAGLPDVKFSPSAPVFLPLPFDGLVAAEMVEAARTVEGRTFLVKEHPMTPYAFDDTDTVRRTDQPLGKHEKLSAVVYAATTVGLESLLAGIPTFRFRPRSCIAIDILPDSHSVAVVDAENISDVLDDPQPVQPPERESFFAPVDVGQWREVLKVEV